MKIVPEIAIHEKVKDINQQKETGFRSSSKSRRNNRKANRARKVQFVAQLISLFPLQFRYKNIKT